MFGLGKSPNVGRSVGKALREFKLAKDLRSMCCFAVHRLTCVINLVQANIMDMVNKSEDLEKILNLSVHG
ncbi:twin-arginine translocase TatA/TatE family subunit [Desulfosporosinus sp. I2]|uniref:twin-arginine translocase TatA/TatE family subunit n=1 Tax=Desulfosporosinus sp. I2 TaxID=1617025 RepID=UPI001FA7A4A8